MSATEPRPAEQERLEQLEAQHVDQLARAHDALAASQDRLYWLDRWGLDLNSLMRRRGASTLRLALRGTRKLVRAVKKGRREASRLPEQVRKARASE